MTILIELFILFICKMIYPCRHFISKRQSKNIEISLKGQCIEMNIKQKNQNKNMTNDYIFS